jgi:hypothetical protein
MSLVDRILCLFFKHVDIVKFSEEMGEEVLYLRRWFLWKGKNGSRYLHKICMPDDDPDPHDHPWDFHIRVLSGGYTDHQYSWDGKKTVHTGAESMTEGTKVFRLAEHIHQVKLHRNPKDPTKYKPCWTLIKLGPYKREWNFFKPDQRVQWDKYLNVEYDGSTPYDEVVKTT